MTLPRTLHIIYRHVHRKAEARSRDPNKARPDWFSYEVCFRNLLQTVRADAQAARVRILILFDGTMDDFVDDFSAHYYANRAFNLSVEFIDAGSDMKSYLTALERVRTSPLPDTDLIYFLENDYLHQPGWVSKLFELYEATPHRFDFVSLYDHRDKYDFEMYDALRSKLVYAPTHHWRTAPSTCGTFILEKGAVVRDFDVWTSNLMDYERFPKLSEERGRVLLTPVPGLATHSMRGYLAPTIDWAARADEAATGALA